MEIIRYEKKYQDQWEEFVSSSSNGTIFHTRKFLSYHAPAKFKDSSLLFLEDNKIVSVLTAVEIKKDGVLTLNSHQGASFGGFVYKDSLSIRHAFSLTESLVEFSAKNKIKKIVVTHSPFVYQRRYNNYVDFAFMKNNFQYLKREVSSVVALDVGEDNVLKLFRAEARTSLRKAEKLGVIIRKSDDYEEYYSILKSNLALRHNVQPAHTLDELIRLQKLFPQKIQLIGAYLKNKMIAGVVNFYCNDKVVLVFYISHNPEFQEYRAVNLLFYNIIKEGISRELDYLDFGLFTVNMEPNWGLGRFKESFGARGILRDTWYLDLTY